jgi:hypothetical protein
METNSLSVQLTCPCTGKCYKNANSLKIHQKSNVHIAWENSKKQKDELIKINRLEIEISHLKRLNFILLERINDLEKKNN